MKPRTIYEYDDYRMFLKEAYESRREEDPKYSARKFASEAGFSNPGFLNDVVKGRRKLSKDAREKMIRAFDLQAHEADFFRLLVEHNQTKDVSRRDVLYREIAKRRNHSMFTRLDPALSKYYQDPAYPLVRTAVMACDFRGNFERLSRFMFPSLPAGEIERYVEDLVEWGLIRVEPDGRYVATTEIVEPPESLGETVRRLNRRWMQQAIEAQAVLPASKRNISTRLFAVSPGTAVKMGQRIEEFTRELWDMVKNDPDTPGCVMQFGVQYFPRSKNGDRA